LVGCFAFQAGSLDKRRSEGGANMDKRKLWNLISAPGLAVTSLLFVFLLLGWHTAGATLDGDSTFSEIRAPSATFTVSGTVTCEATGPIADVEVSAWDQLRSSVVASDTTDSSGNYSVTLDGGTYYVEFIPPIAAGLDAKAFTTTEVVADTVLDVNFCVCSGIWVTETVDSAGNVGAHNSLALAPTYPYTPHISYWHLIAGSEHYLKHAWLSGTTWLSETVDSGGDTTSLALVPSYPYTPCISHHHWGEWALKYACRGSEKWITLTVAGNRANDSSLALEPVYPYVPHISYLSRIPRTIRHAYLSGTTWMSGTWMGDYVEPGGSGAGARSSLALESSLPYTPHISYYDGANGALKHAWKSGTIWPSETVDSAGGVGKTSLALDSNTNPHISYYDGTDANLRYAWKSGTTWLTETIDSVGKPRWTMVATSLELDQANMPYISYYDAINGDLKWARFDGRVWIVQTVDSEGDAGGGNSLALDLAGCPHISYLDATDWPTDTDLKYAYIPAVYSAYLPLVMRNYP
jgi:hypothetical protein